MAQFSRAIFADPVHRVMDFGSDDVAEKLTEIIDAREFQRLRRISQLGLASLVFPGATHTRFIHSLGASYLAKRVFAHLEAHASDGLPGDVVARIRLEKLVRVAALLHDVGHGPFSHAFERVRVDGDKKIAPSHEEWSQAIVQNSLRALIEPLGVEVAAVAALLGKDASNLPDGVPLWAQQLVSSQLDVDRLDYLPRDAHFAGVSM